MYIYVFQMSPANWVALRVGGVDSYLDTMAQLGTWADGIMLEAAASRYDRQVVVLSTSQSQPPVVTYHGAATVNSPIMLQYVDGNHYVSLVPRQ